MLKRVFWCCGASLALVVIFTTVAATEPRDAISQPSKDAVIQSPTGPDSPLIEFFGGGWDLNGPDLAGSRVGLSARAEQVGVDLANTKYEKRKRPDKRDNRDKQEKPKNSATGDHLYLYGSSF